MRLFLKFIVFCVLLGVTMFCLSLPPRDAPDQYTLIVEQGDTLHSIATKLSSAHAIRSETLFIVYARIFGNERSIYPGEYIFKKPTVSYNYALNIVGGIFGIQKTKLLIPEGSTGFQIATSVHQAFPTISVDDFYALIKDKEGYLFPDTYAFFPSTTKEDILARIQENFEYKIGFFDTRIKQSGRTELQILTMASIIEKEAFGDADRAVIAGILWNRFDKGMPLQVDASMLFANRFDTYENKGLPTAPIDNPGAKAIEAALAPKDSAFWYYLHDKSGTVHYAVSFAEHKKNIQAYLK